MAVSNRDRVGKALELLREGLAPFFQRQMEIHHKARWLEVAKKSFDTDKDPLKDVHAMLKVMTDQWRNIFGKTLGHAERSLVGELMDVRNKWAHQEPFNTDDAERALDSVRRLLTAVSAEQATEVDRQRRELLRIRFEEQARQEGKKAASEPVHGQPSAGYRPWREIATPHPDVASGRYQQAEFAADLAQVYRGEAADEYKDPREFFRRTHLTEGLSQLLLLALRRLSDAGGDPVVDLQTNFGGGKTHSLLALYHLFSGADAANLPGIEPLLKEADVDRPPEARRAVIVGTAISPGQPHLKEDGTEVRTIWGEIAWQLGGREGYALIAEADRTATNPPRDAFLQLFEKYSPCLILMDEWVAYARQLVTDDSLPAGTIDTHATFAQALTEAVKAAPRTLLVVSIPVSDRMSEAEDEDWDTGDIEIGGEAGRRALDRLRSVIGRVQSPWRPASPEESFEIVRRRLFEPMDSEAFTARDAVARAFSVLYQKQKSEFPSTVVQAGYEDRIKAAYPIHPELFDRLYEDWSSLPRFQRTRGILRLMAAVIHTLWERGDSNLLIMPGTVPVDERAVQNELTRYLEENWVPIIDSDVDGPNSLPLRLDRDNPNLSRFSACRRVARTIFMGSAPLARMPHKGVDDGSVKLGCVQPGESPAVFGDALRRLTDDATYLYVDGKRYWYGTQPSVTKEAQKRAEQISKAEVHDAIVSRLRLDRNRGDFAAVHAAPDSSADIPDDAEARLVVLSPETTHVAKNETSPARVAAAGFLEKRGEAQRRYSNMLVFLAPDESRIRDLEQAVRNHLAWKSICEEKDQLNLDAFQTKQAETKRAQMDEAVKQRIPETYCWVLVPGLPTPDERNVQWEEHRAQGTEPLAARASKKLKDAECLICQYAPTRVRMDLDRVPLWQGDHIGLKQLWEYYSQYLYLPRLRDRQVLLEAVQDGVASTTWTDAFAFAEGWDEGSGRYVGLHTGEQVGIRLDDLCVLVKPDAATKQQESERPAPAGEQPTGSVQPGEQPPGSPVPGETPTPPTATRPRRFHGTVRVDPVRLSRDADQIAEAVIQHLTALMGADVEVTLEIQATVPEGVPEDVERTVTENARTLKFEPFGFEKE